MKTIFDLSEDNLNMKRLFWDEVNETFKFENKFTLANNFKFDLENSKKLSNPHFNQMKA
jgi:hypothetical protein